MRPFRIALTGDYLTVDGKPGKHIGLDLLEAVPYIRHHFIKALAPSPDDPSYWIRQYSLLVEPEHIAEVDALAVLRPWIKRSTFANGAQQLVVIARAGVGYDKIDVQAATENDVLVFNSPDSLTHPTASSALMFMLALAKKLPQQDRITRQGRWDLQYAFTGSEIQQRTLGIIGFGKIGRELARLAAPFDMHMLAYSPKADPQEASRLNVTLVSLDTVMRESDYVCVCSNLTPDKHRMIRAEHLALMKPTAYFINVARGELVDQQALVEVLRERQIAGAGLDVYEEEPLPATDPLIALDNVILTPHWSPATDRVGIATGKVIFGGLLRVAQGELPPNILNPAVLDRPGFQTKLARFAENKEAQHVGQSQR